jgi:hypothetical protein
VTGPNFHEPDQGPDQARRDEFTLAGPALTVRKNAVGTVLALADTAWLRQFLVDTLNTDFLSAYQCELVGDVPPAVLAWAGVDDDWAEQ